MRRPVPSCIFIWVMLHFAIQPLLESEASLDSLNLDLRLREQWEVGLVHLPHSPAEMHGERLLVSKMRNRCSNGGWGELMFIENLLCAGEGQTPS